MVGKTKHQTVSDQIRLSILAEMPCIPCMIDRVFGVPSTIQHVTDCGRRYADQHQATYPSCEWHHLGLVNEAFAGSIRLFTEARGPSLFHSKKSFLRQYGQEVELIQIADALVRHVRRQRSRQTEPTPTELGHLCVALHREIVMGIKPSEEMDSFRRRLSRPY